MNKLVLILLVASGASFILKDAPDALIILVVLLLGIFINFFQTYRSQQAIRKLRDHVTPTATALRDGKYQEVKRQEIVPGDIVKLSAGDLVPADGKLIEARDLYIQQAALTGESLPAEKNAQNTGEEGPNGADSPNLVFLGTSVVSGIGTAAITATGSQTAFGAIAARLVARPEETEFERSMKHFGQLIMRAVFFLVLFILVVRVALHKDAFESFVICSRACRRADARISTMITSANAGARRGAHGARPRGRATSARHSELRHD